MMRTLVNLFKIDELVEPEVMVIGHQCIYVFHVRMSKNNHYLHDVFFSYEIRLIFKLAMHLHSCLFYWKDEHFKLEDDVICHFFEDCDDHLIIMIN